MTGYGSRRVKRRETGKEKVDIAVKTNQKIEVGEAA